MQQISRATYSQSAQDKAKPHHYFGMDARQQPELNKLAPYLEEARNSDNDHGPEDEDNAGWDLNKVSGVAATSSDPPPPHVMPISWKYKEAIKSTYAHEGILWRAIYKA